MGMGVRGTNGRPSTEAVTDPEAARAEAIKAIFRDRHKHLANLFPKDGQVTVARCLSSALMALKLRDEKSGELTLRNVPPEEIAEKCIACHHMGLEPVVEAYLIPYGNRITIIKAPQGLIKLMANAGWRIEARAVREGDFFEHDLGTDGFIKHRKSETRRDGEVTFGYAFARHKDGGPVVMEVLSRDDIEHYRGQSKQKNGPMWTGNYEGAVRKTMIHRIAELLPLPASVRADVRDESAHAGVEVSEEILSLLRDMSKRPVEAAPPEPEHVPATSGASNDAGREPGSDDR